MRQIETLFVLAESFAAAKGIGEARVSTLVFNDGKRLQRVRDGRDIGTRSIDRAIRWFSEHWPEGVDWPDAIERPRPGLPRSPAMQALSSL